MLGRGALIAVAARAVVGVCRAATASGTIVNCAGFWHFGRFCIALQRRDAYAQLPEGSLFCITFAAEELAAQEYNSLFRCIVDLKRYLDIYGVS